jgi:hypothetical protein
LCSEGRSRKRLQTLSEGPKLSLESENWSLKPDRA